MTVVWWLQSFSRKQQMSVVPRSASGPSVCQYDSSKYNYVASDEVFSNPPGESISRIDAPHLQVLMLPRVSSKNDFVSKMADGSASITEKTCGDVYINKDGKECQFACKYSNGYSVLWAWSVTLGSQGTMNPFYPSRSNSGTTTGSSSATQNSGQNAGIGAFSFISIIFLFLWTSTLFNWGINVFDHIVEL